VETEAWHPAQSRFLDILDDPLYPLIVDLLDLLLVETTAFWSERSVRAAMLPITTDSISSPMGPGSDSLPVQIDLFGRPTFLADSMQFMLEYACRLAGNGAWYVLPSFRGENADQTHLNQFFHSEAELPVDLEALLNVVNEYVTRLASAVIGRFSERVAAAGGNLERIAAVAALPSIPCMTFDAAADLLRDLPGGVSVLENGSRTLTRIGEARLQDLQGPALWVTHWDHFSTPFYQAASQSDPTKALNADLLLGGVEIAGAGQRHCGGDEVRAALVDRAIDGSSYDWYIAMKDKAPMTTSGFGMGVERWLQWTLNAPDIRDLQLAPRLNGQSIRP
jgi:asparaginyl-tRNA synthetase